MLKHLKSIGILAAIQTVMAVISVTYALVLKKIVDSAVGKEKELFIQSGIVLIVIILLQLLLRAFVRYLEEYTKSDIENDLKEKALRTIMSKDYARISKVHTGEIHNRLTGDATAVADGMTTILPTLLSMITKLVCGMVVIYTLDKLFALLLCIGGMMVLGVSYVFRSKMKTLHKRTREADGSVRSFLQELLSSLLVVKAFAGEEKAVGEAEERMIHHKNARMEKNKFFNLSQFGFSLVLNGGTALGILWCGVGIIRGTITYGTLIAVQQLMGQIQQPFANVSGLLPRYFSMQASAERLKEFERIEDEWHACTKSSEEIKHAIGNFWRIYLEDVSFSYPDDQSIGYVLEHVNFTVYRGDYIAVTGESGIGKSTLIRLLLAVYQCGEGRIRVASQEKEYDMDADFRRMFAYVPQGSSLMSGTIYSAVSFFVGQEEKEDEEIRNKVEEACRIACADEFVRELPQGYNTYIGERGAGLSEGQIQRLAIARAVLSSAPVLLLDESTSALDEATEAQVLSNLRKMPGKTVIIITHRKAALSICNRIVEMKDSKIIETRRDYGRQIEESGDSACCDTGSSACSTYISG